MATIMIVEDDRQTNDAVIRYNKLRKFQNRRIENSPKKTRDKVSVIW